MKKLLHNRSFHIALAATVIVTVFAMVIKISSHQPQQLVTATVDTGNVQQLVSVSGVADAEETAELAFPVTGIVKEVKVRKGDVVQAGDILMTLEASALAADRQDALAALARARATRDELLNGPSDSDRTVTAETVGLKLQALENTKNNEERKVNNAYRTLLSSGLAVSSNDPSEDATPPTVSGTYICDDEGIYTVQVFSSGSDSGYSYRLSGIETGTFVASDDQATPLGTCGLQILFDSTSASYHNSVWEIAIPNTRSANYVTNLNAYNLAVTQAQTAIDLAKQDVALAEANAANDNAPARLEAVARANADVAQAEARLARIDANISDRVLRAPFPGTITELEVLPGETVTNAPVVTLLAASAFEVTARIPEIDIGKLETGQTALMTFDARDDEVVTGVVDFISLKATEIDGVAYYEALITLDTLPPWMRSGLNADIDIVIKEELDTLRVPKRFITNTVDGPVVLKQSGEAYATSTIKVLFEGNDGYVAITGLNVGDTVVAP